MSAQRAVQAVRFEATEVRDEGDDAGHLVFWCPWCEALHYHGACGGNGKGDGHRTAHCVADRRSPLLAGGVELVTSRKAASYAAVQPDIIMAGRMPFRAMLWHRWDKFRAVTLQALFGMSAAKARGATIGHNIKGKAGILIFGRAQWEILPKHGGRICGQGFLRLAALLYGIPAGVAAVRLLEEVSAETFDAETVFAIQAAVDGWIDRGAPARERSQS